MKVVSRDLEKVVTEGVSVQCLEQSIERAKDQSWLTTGTSHCECLSTLLSSIACEVSHCLTTGSPVGHDGRVTTL